jgi:hypothetical protein
LGSWIDVVLRLGEETGRASVTFNYVGRLLAYAPADADGGWPHRAVRIVAARKPSATNSLRALAAPIIVSDQKWTVAEPSAALRAAPK